MFKKTEKILKVFYTRMENRNTSVMPAFKTIPQWYKKAPSKINPNNKNYDYDGNIVPVSRTALLDTTTQYGETFKHCTPFLDSLTIGYMVVLEEDLEFDGESEKFLNNNLVQTILRPFEVEGYPLSDEYVKRFFKWSVSSRVELPKGYTFVCMTPLNRLDLPFYTLPGIIDDGHPLETNPPFLMKKGFSGIIPKGTPIIQIIPFKREDWKMVDAGFGPTVDDPETVQAFFEFNKDGYPKAGVYKKKIRKRKNFN